MTSDRFIDGTIIRWCEHGSYGFVAFGDGQPDAYMHRDRWRGAEAPVVGERVKVRIVAATRGPRVADGRPFNEAA